MLQTTGVAAEAARWSSEAIPLDGQMGKWQLAAGSDPQYLTQAPDGTIYCYANPALTTDTLFKSLDGGLSWETTGRVKDLIVDIAVCPQDSNLVYYATAAKVCKSTDAGSTFTNLPLSPGGAGAGNIQITSLDVVKTGTGNLVIVSTRDTDAGQFGGIYLLDESVAPLAWTDTAVSAYDVCRVAFSPAFASEPIIYTVATDETDSFLAALVPGEAWGATYSPATLAGTVAAHAVLAFPDDYAATGAAFIGIDTGVNTGDVYLYHRAQVPAVSSVTDLNAGAPDALAAVDIYSLNVSGNTAGASILAGAAASPRVYASADSGGAWTGCRQPPTGQNKTCVVKSVKDAGIFALTAGVESAFSVSTDNGQNWRQISLIDTKINNIYDLAVALYNAPSPALYLVTQDSTGLTNSVWRRAEMSPRWQRIFCSTLPGVKSLQYALCPPVYGTRTVFLAGENSVGPATWVSQDAGQTFTMHAAPFPVSCWTALDDAKLFIGGYSGGKGVIARSQDAGATFPDTAEAGVNTICSLAISPAFAQDKTMLAGNNSGRVFWSQNGGLNFEPVGQQLPVTGGIGKISLAFDRSFNGSRLIYAATDSLATTTSKERIFRFTLQQSAAWQSLYAGLPAGAYITRLFAAADGSFYALNSQAVVAADGKGGLLRTLAATDPSFETVSGGLAEGTNLQGFWCNGQQYWAIDATKTGLLTISDYFVYPPVAGTPADKAAGLATDVTLDWSVINGANEYEWQVCDHATFANVPAATRGTCAASSVRVNTLTPGTIYYWRVRITKPFASPWSAALSFSTALGGDGISPSLNQPANGVTTGVKPVFQWGTIAGADRYELVIAGDANFTAPLYDFTGARALTANAWQCEATLDYDTAYFWKVRACTATNFSAWSAVNAFLTASPPVPATTPATANIPAPVTVTAPPTTPPTTQINIIAPENPTPVYSPTNIVEFNFPDWALITFLAIMALMALALLALVILIFKIVRP